jgi:hypothetical protein
MCELIFEKRYLFRPSSRPVQPQLSSPLCRGKGRSCHTCIQEVGTYICRFSYTTATMPVVGVLTRWRRQQGESSQFPKPEVIHGKFLLLDDSSLKAVKQQSPSHSTHSCCPWRWLAQEAASKCCCCYVILAKASQWGGDSFCLVFYSSIPKMTSFFAVLRNRSRNRIRIILTQVEPEPESYPCSRFRFRFLLHKKYQTKSTLTGHWLTQV